VKIIVSFQFQVHSGSVAGDHGVQNYDRPFCNTLDILLSSLLWFPIYLLTKTHFSTQKFEFKFNLKIYKTNDKKYLNFQIQSNMLGQIYIKYTTCKLKTI
jgi:hypothetical protein